MYGMFVFLSWVVAEITLSQATCRETVEAVRSHIDHSAWHHSEVRVAMTTSGPIAFTVCGPDPSHFVRLARVAFEEMGKEIS
jgi:hypothetical protein